MPTPCAPHGAGRADAAGTFNVPVPGRIRLSSEALLAGAREVIIAHGSEEYRLRVTSQGKLILTK